MVLLMSTTTNVFIEKISNILVENILWVGKKKKTHSLSEALKPCLEVIKLFSCSTQLSMKFSLLINLKMPAIVGIFLFISRENLCSALFSKKEFAIVNKVRFISRTNFMLS